MVKNLPAMWETWARSLGWEDSLEEGMATRSCSCLEIPVERGAWQAIVHGVTKQLGDQTQVSHIAGRFFTN